MNFEQANERLPFFHFGKVAPQERQEFEQFLLENRDFLLQYFALKREIEETEFAPNETPSKSIRANLIQELNAGKSWYRRPMLGMGAGIAAAAALLFYLFLISKPEPPQPGILIDTPDLVALDYI